MSENRKGGSDRAGEVGARPSVVIVLNPSYALVMNRGAFHNVPTELGLNRDNALKSRVDFANRLLKLGNDMLSQPAYASLPKDLPDDPDLALKALRPVLELSEKDARKVLNSLRTLGAPLRKEFSGSKMAKVLPKYGLHPEAANGQVEPALTFVVAREHESAKAPILWSMFYEGDQQGDADWRRFWGFRIPITQWLMEIDRDPDLKLERALSAIGEDLRFPRHEVAVLANRLGGKRCYTLAHIVREFADRDLVSRLSESETALPSNTCKAEEPAPTHVAGVKGSDVIEDVLWLAKFLEGRDEDEREAWKRAAWKAIFTAPETYDVVHFACHCAHDDNEWLSTLKLRVAGESLALNVSLLNTDLDRKNEEDWQSDDPGPLVFLNACATGQQNEDDQFPGFPVEWIQRQGAKAVIVTLCKVPDAFAYAFAVKFYDILLSAVMDRENSDPASIRNRYVAEALLQTRRFFMEEYNNPLGLAYDLYAARDLRVVDDFNEVGGNQ